MSGWHLIFWEPSVSPHKLDLVRALSQHPAIASCRYVSDRGLSADRIEQGWQLSTLDDLTIITTPSSDEISALVAESGENAIHLFSGLRGPRVIVEGLHHAMRHRARFLLLSEPRASEGWRGVARWVHSWLSERELRRHTAGVLAIGRNGPAWFRRTGYRQEQIFPFAYFLPEVPHHPIDETSSDLVRVGYLGRLVGSKGIGLLLDAAPLLPPNMRIEIAGHGVEAARVKEAAAASKGLIAYHGAIAMETVPAFLNCIDILVQPSLTTDDGWAAVISEALLAGDMVVASAKAGASILLDSPDRGHVIHNFDARSLADTLIEIGNGQHLTPANRAIRRAWAHKRLTGEAGADYLVAIIAHLFAGAARPSPYYA